MLIGKSSRRVIDSVDPVLGDVISAALIAAPARFDFSAVSGKRTAEQQFELYKKGRTLINGIWVVVDKQGVVTYKDGHETPSNHQDGNAIDIVRYYKGKWYWGDADSVPLANFVVGFALARGVELGGGYIWEWDYGHLELMK